VQLGRRFAALIKPGTLKRRPACAEWLALFAEGEGSFQTASGVAGGGHRRLRGIIWSGPSEKAAPGAFRKPSIVDCADKNILVKGVMEVLLDFVCGDF